MYVYVVIYVIIIIEENRLWIWEGIGEIWKELEGDKRNDINIMYINEIKRIKSKNYYSIEEVEK